jgi:hypothetical protein
MIHEFACVNLQSKEDKNIENCRRSLKSLNDGNKETRMETNPMNLADDDSIRLNKKMPTNNNQIQCAVCAKWFQSVEHFDAHVYVCKPFPIHGNAIIYIWCSVIMCMMPKPSLAKINKVP